MESVGFYWSYFLAVQAQDLRFLLSEASGWGLYASMLTAYAYILFWRGCEYLRPLRPNQPKWRNGLLTDLFYPIFNYIIAWLLVGHAFVETVVLVSNHALYHFSGLTDFKIVSLARLPTWANLVLLFLFTDLLSWASHWTRHRFDFLWQFHQVHHSSSQIDAFNSQRIHFGEILYGRLFFLLPLSLIGFSAHEVFATVFLRTLLSNFTHANVRLPLGPLKYIVNNPQIHIWHHARAVDSRRNVNYGDALIVWDYLFRTAYLPGDAPEDLELAFDGAEDFPTSFQGQLVAPFVGIARKLRGRRRPAGVLA